MSERAAMKRRVRGLLHRKWFAPLGALLLAGLPVVLLSGLLIWLMRPANSPESMALSMQFSFSLENPRELLSQILLLLTDPMLLIQPLIGWLPLLACLLGLHIFIGMPICVSVSGYFLAFLRGKNPRIISVFSCFSGRYPRAFGGMLYKLLWVLLWFTVSIVAPGALLLCSALIVSVLGISFNAQLYLFVAILAVSLLWFVIFFFIFLNRMLAYSLTPICIAAQPRLASSKAIRLSRKLMRGCKWQLVGLIFSFLHYFLPALISGIALLALPLLSLPAQTVSLARTVLLCILLANQLVWIYLLPYATACFHAFYIERKREALMDEELTPEDFATPSSIEGNPADTGKD